MRRRGGEVVEGRVLDVSVMVEPPVVGVEHRQRDDGGVPLSWDSGVRRSVLGTGVLAVRRPMP